MLAGALAAALALTVALSSVLGHRPVLRHT